MRKVCLGPDKLEAAITPRTKAVVPVGIYGQCTDMTRINEIAGRCAIPVIEDAAQSFGATQNGKRSCRVMRNGRFSQSGESLARSSEPSHASFLG